MKLQHSCLILSILLTLITGCSGGSPDNGSSTQPGTQPGTQQPGTQAPGTVVNRIEKAGEIDYKIYLQSEANAGNRKGLVLLGSGGEEQDPKTGSLEGGLENNVANELAKQGYVAAIVAYRDQPPVGANYENWDSNCEMMAVDFSQVANAIIAKEGGGLTRAKVLTGGVSYATYCLFNSNGTGTTLADTRGILGACGATSEFAAKNFKVPIYSLHCPGGVDGDPKDGNYNGQALIDFIGNATVKADSGFYTDTDCTAHCGGDMSLWTSKLVERTRQWLP